MCTWLAIKRRKEGQAENSIPPKTPFSGTGRGEGLKARDISKVKQSEYQGADQTAVIHRQICAFSYS